MAQPTYRLDVPTAFITDDAGYLADPFTIDVELFDIEGETKRATPVAIGASAPATRIGKGYFYASQAADVAALPVGTTSARRMIRWTVVLEDGDDPIVFETQWERLSARVSLAMPSYCLVSDLRDEGFTAATISDVRAQILIARASKMIERYTGRVFAPVPRRVSMNGRGGSILQFGEAIVAIDSLYVSATPRESGVIAMDPEIVRVYSRHLTQRLANPDDRENPKLELFTPLDFRLPYSAATADHYTFERLTFPRGVQNVDVLGVWGYTDPDGSPMGRTPDLIRHVTMLLVKRELATIGSGDRDDASAARRVTAERTRDQSITYASIAAGSRSGTPILGAFTGDPEIDTVIAMYVRPAGLAAV